MFDEMSLIDGDPCSSAQNLMRCFFLCVQCMWTLHGLSLPPTVATGGGARSAFFSIAAQSLSCNCPFYLPVPFTLLIFSFSTSFYFHRLPPLVSSSVSVRMMWWTLLGNTTSSFLWAMMTTCSSDLPPTRYYTFSFLVEFFFGLRCMDIDKVSDFILSICGRILQCQRSVACYLHIWWSSPWFIRFLFFAALVPQQRQPISLALLIAWDVGCV